MALKGTKALQSWCVKVTAGYPGVKVENMTKSWKDGLAFCAIIHHFRPELIDFSSLSKKNVRENCTLAFEVAERELGIPALLDPEDMVSMASPDKLSILTYLSQYYNFFKDKKSGGPPPMTPISIDDPSGKDVEISDKGKEIRRRSFKRAKEKENKAAQSGPLPAKISMKSDKCEICSKRVFLVERQVVDGRLFHRNCFRCTKCRSTLRPDSYKLTKDPKKFECMCHSDNGDIWNLRMNPTSRAGARLAGVEEEGGTIWQSRSPKSSPRRPEQPPPKQPSEVKTTTPAEPVAGNAKSIMPPVVGGSKPPFPGAVPLIHPHLLKNAARARFNPSGSPVGSPQLQRHPHNGSVSSLATQRDVDMATSQDTLNKTPADSPPRPVPLPRVITKPQENGGVSAGKEASDTSTEKSTTESSSEDFKARENGESTLFSTDDESKSSSDVRSVQEGDSLGFESSDLDNINDSFNKAYRDTDDTTTSTEESTAQIEVPSPKDVKEEDGDTSTDESPKSEEPMEVSVDQNEDISVANKENDKEKDTLNTVNQNIPKDGGKTDVEIGTNDVIDKSVEEGSTGDSALWDTKAELSDSFQDENSESKKPEEDASVKTNNKAVEKKGEEATRPNVVVKDERTEGDKNKLKENEVQVEGSSGKKSGEADVNYDDSLNPFGSEEDLDVEETGNRQSTNPFESDEDDDEGYDKSLNPFGDDDDDDDDEGNATHVSEGSVNPFTGSPIEETPFSLRLKGDTRAASFSHSKRPERPPPPILSSGSYSVKTRSQILEELKRDRETLKKKRSAPPRPPGGSPGSVQAPPRSRKSRKAPQPPQGVTPKAASDGEIPNLPAKTRDGESAPTPVPRTGQTANGTKIEPVPSPRMRKVQKPERPKYAPPPRAHSQGKRKAPAPPAIKREVGKDHIEVSLIQQELMDIEKRQRELEERGVELEMKLRKDTDDDAAHDDVLLTEWFDVVNQKNKLVRREGELIAQAQQQELELQHAEIEYELRVLLTKQEHERIDADAQREEQLLEMLMEVVQKRNQIVERLEEDRLREEAEDRDIEAMMGTGKDSDKKKDGGKEKKHKKKHKLGLIK